MYKIYPQASMTLSAASTRRLSSRSDIVLRHRDYKKKTGDSKTVTVKQHNRTLTQNVYGIVCKDCKQATERITYAFSAPKYCEPCANDRKFNKGKKNKKKSNNVVYPQVFTKK